LKGVIMSGYGGVDDDATNAQEIVNNYIALAISRLPTGESSQSCHECGYMIPLARRRALPGVKHCIPCQVERDKIKIRIKTVTYML
jgi:phage/conjugal plasmid C-4 type zinc finger TraR family protein